MTDPIKNPRTNTATSTVQQSVDHARGLDGPIAETGYRNRSDCLDL